MLELIIAFVMFIASSTIVLIRLLTKQKVYDGSLVVSTKEDGTKLFSLELNDDPETFENKPSIVFKVVHQAEDPPKPSIKIIE